MGKEYLKDKNKRSEETNEYKGKNIIILCCTSCNVKCKHCYINYKGDIEGNKLKDMINIFKSKYQIMINGSEPILHKEYLESYKANNQEYILTNGLALMKDKSLMLELKKNNIQKISISYHFDMHEKISEIKKEKIELLVKELSDNGFDVRLLTTISNLNYMNVLKHCDKAHDMGAKAIKFTNYIKQGEAKKNNEINYSLSEKEIVVFFEKLNEARSKYKKEELLIQRCGSFGPSKLNDNFICPAVNDNVVLTPNGDVYPCIFLIDEKYKIGYYDKKIYVDSKKIINCGTKCLAHEYCNKKRSKNERDF